jgi:hypothetical protein
MYDRMHYIKLNLEAIEPPEAKLMSNENATDYAKQLFKWIVLHCLQLSASNDLHSVKPSDIAFYSKNQVQNVIVS